MTTDPTAAVPSSGAPRLDYLDALRGMAALGVVFFHYSLAEKQAHFGAIGGAVVYALVQVLDLGKLGVVLFFAISGFIIPSSLYRGRGSPIVRFMTSRFCRLYPLYWLSSIACLIFLARSELPDLRTILLNVTMVQGFLGAHDINGVAWTLQIELVFYAVCLGMFVSGVLRSVRAKFAAFGCSLLLALLLAVVRFLMARKLPVALPLGISVMFLGCIWRSVILDHEQMARGYALKAIIVFAALLPVICLLAYSRNYGYDESPLPYILCYGCGVAIFLLGTTKLRVHGRIFVHLGTISYSVYLLHTPVYLAAERFGLIPAADAGPLVFWSWLIAMMCAVILVSHLSYMMIEKPFIELGRSVIRLRKPVARATADT